MTDAGSVAKALAGRVRSLRVAARLTQSEVAFRAGVTVETVSRIERILSGAPSANPNPSLETLERVAAALGVEIVELLGAPLSPRQEEDGLSTILRAASPATRRRIERIAEVLVKEQFEAPDA